MTVMPTSTGITGDSRHTAVATAVRVVSPEPADAALRHAAVMGLAQAEDGVWAALVPEVSQAAGVIAARARAR